jgi:hypothetical protein
VLDIEADGVDPIDRIQCFIDSISSVQALSQVPTEQGNSVIENISTFVGAIQEIIEYSMDMDNEMGKSTSHIYVLEDLAYTF